MKRVIVKFGVGYGMHETDFDGPDDMTEEEIKECAQECVMERLDWSYEVVND